MNGLRPLLTRDEDLNLLASNLEESREVTTAEAVETEDSLVQQPESTKLVEDTIAPVEKQERTATFPAAPTVAELPSRLNGGNSDI